MGFKGKPGFRRLLGRKGKSGLEYAVSTHEGRVRENNEDNFWVDGHFREDVEKKELHLGGRAGLSRFAAAICDGMGGVQGGSVASATAAEVFVREVQANLRSDMSPEQIRQVWLAGGFGYFLDVQAAIALGLLPQGLEGRVTAVGNTALAGAWIYGNEPDAGERLNRLRAVTQVLNLAEQQEFESGFVEAMYLRRL